MTFQPSDDLSIDWDTTLTYSLAWRTESRDHKLVANADGNDGDNAFDKGSLINNRAGLPRHRYCLPPATSTWN
ncbi:DUF1302 family protein [Pseudomonas sp.]|uniref:DUF1302 family protein n=1 Tax=Pseudomonas sp. TaxID=306 RepID=UPI003D6FCAAD